MASLFNKDDPPPPPDPTVTAQAQTGSNIDTALANARLNRVNQTTPWGSINYTQGPVDEHGVPTYSSQISLSPEQQQLLDQQQSQQLTRGNLASQLLSQAGEGLSRPLDLSNIHPMYDRYASGGAGGGASPGGGAHPPGTMPPNPIARGPGGTGIQGMVPGMGGNSTPGAVQQPPPPNPSGGPQNSQAGPETNPLMQNQKLMALVQALRSMK